MFRLGFRGLRSMRGNGLVFDLVGIYNTYENIRKILQNLCRGAIIMMFFNLLILRVFGGKQFNHLLLKHNPRFLVK